MFHQIVQRKAAFFRILIANGETDLDIHPTVTIFGVMHLDRIAVDVGFSLLRFRRKWRIARIDRDRERTQPLVCAVLFHHVSDARGDVLHGFYRCHAAS